MVVCVGCGGGVGVGGCGRGAGVGGYLSSTFCPNALECLEKRGKS